MSPEKLKSNSKENYPINLVEAYYPRDEIIYAGLEIKEKIKTGLSPNEVVILVPKNHQVRSTITILRNMGLPVAGGDSLNLFDTPDAISFVNLLKIISNPNDGVALGNSFFYKLSNIPPIKAHEYKRKQK